MNDEIRAARNQRRAYRKATDMLLVESELLLAQHLNALLKEKPGTLSPEQRQLLPVLVEMLGSLKDQRMAAAWGVKLSTAIMANPRLLDGAPGVKRVHKVAGMAAKVGKAAKPDARTQAERKLKAAVDKAADALYGPMALPTSPVAEKGKLRGDDLLDGIE